MENQVSKCTEEGAMDLTMCRSYAIWPRIFLRWNAGENWLELVEEELRGRELDIGNMKTFPPYFTW